MVASADWLASSADFMPHGVCFSWTPSLLWLHVLSDATIVVSYYAISFLLLFLVKKKEIPFSWMIVLFALFIMACGTTHALEIWTIWRPDYWASGYVKLVTAVVSAAAFISLFPIMPKILRIPSLGRTLAELERSNTALAEAREELERKIAERTRELQETATLSETIIQSLPGLFYLFDARGKMVRGNNNFARVSGYTPEDLVGMPAVAFIAPPDREEVTARIQETFIRGQSSVEARFLTKGGEQILHYFNGLRVILNGMPHLLGSGVDMTERKRLEDEMRKARETAEAATRAKSLFLANMSHEIRTPMNTIVGMGYLLSQTPLNPDQQGKMHKIQHAAENLLGIINDILDFSKIESGKLELEHAPFRLDALMEKVTDMLALRAEEKGLEIVCSLPPDLPAHLVGDG